MNTQPEPNTRSPAALKSSCSFCNPPRSPGMAATTSPLRLTTGGTHDLPEHRVIGMPAAVVAHCGADRLGHFPELGKDILQRHGSDGRMILDRIVEVGHVGR